MAGNSHKGTDDAERNLTPMIPRRRFETPPGIRRDGVAPGDPETRGSRRLNVRELVDYLIDNGLLSAGELHASYEHLCPGSGDTEELLRELVRCNKLTEFQARLISQGDAQRLVLGEYVILKPIGSGGMGEVYQAEHRRMKRVVALKMLLPEGVKQRDVADRFLREARVAAKLSHPNIVTAYDAGEVNGLPFLVMEYVEGTDLAATVRAEGPLPVETALDYVLQAARGLAYAHEHGVIHRDIKPPNLLVDRQGTVKILDMGLARLAMSADERSVTELTQSGMLLGTVDFMAPEQFEGATRVDPRADVYSLGCTLGYLLTGQPVYDGDSMLQRIMAHREQPVPSLRQSRSDVPKALDDLFQRMLAKRPEDRPQSMEQVIKALNACRERREKLSETTERRPRPAASTPTARSRRRWALLCGVAAAGLLVAAVGLIAWLASANGNHVPAGPPEAAAEAVRIAGEEQGSVAKARQADWLPPEPDWSIPEGAELVGIEVLGGRVHYYDRIVRLAREPRGETLAVHFRLIPDGKEPFYLMENKVWNRLFRVFAEERPELLASSDWQRGAVANGQFLGIEGDRNGRLPVVGVPVEDAHRFAAWLGGRLPTMGQWDKAAGLYGKPVGTTRKTNGGSFRQPGDGPPRVAIDREIEGPEPVDETETDDVGPFGCRQMAGNGLEFTRNLFSGRTVPVDDPQNDHVHLRGRSYDDVAPLRYQDFDDPGSFGTQGYGVSDPHIGFRVVVEIPSAGRDD